ncbi:hypothetical protein TELCIR_03653 [Teladorsagia circumcincta]|uniref:PERQ amino acid-rich with GYF domain-containing protein n=2 Tax=Teladorsagia circumcincta TaxID=45464 RepID=A0A2G9UVV5_TELCI|nr:hypothetical protein TELCIR_03653 [Teladorsagia circumcincta]
MSSLSHAERASVATGAAYSGGGNDSAAAGHKGGPGGWTPVKQWGRNHPNTGAPVKGGGPSRPYVPPCRNDRPRNRLRSTSDEGDVAGEGGWTTAGVGKHGWTQNKDGGQQNAWNRELMQLNGRMTPFDYKDDVASHPPVTMFSNPSQPYPPLFASGGMWSDLGAPANMMYSQAGYDPIAAERKRIEEEQRRILEEQAKMREYQEHLVRELQKQREEHEKQLMEQKLALMKHQEEIERRERELKESAEETKARLEMERLALAEKARQIEEERLAKIEEEVRKAEEKRAEEAERKRLEEEERQRIAEKEQLRKQQEAERERRAKEAAEEEARRARAAAEAAAAAEKARIQQQAEAQRKQKAAEESRKNAAAQAEKEKRQEPAKSFEIEEVWQAASSPFWDGPPLQTANKAPSNTSKKSSAEKVSNTKSSASKSGSSALANEKAAKRALGMGEDNSVFLEWVVQRLKELNSTVEAEVLAMFIEGVENPDEVEDYVMGYLGDSKAVKEFVREFLLKRSDFRNRKQHGVKNDLSSARGAPVSGNGAGFSAVQGKKKKNKGARLVVDGSCLGFRATSDPNRVNQGEIETVTIASGQKR